MGVLSGIFCHDLRIMDCMKLFSLSMLSLSLNNPLLLYLVSVIAPCLIQLQHDLKHHDLGERLTQVICTLLLVDLFVCACLLSLLTALGSFVLILISIGELEIVEIVASISEKALAIYPGFRSTASELSSSTKYTGLPDLCVVVTRTPVTWHFSH